MHGLHAERPLLLSLSPFSAVRSIGTSAPLNSCMANPQVLARLVASGLADGMFDGHSS